jgi:hypothetical protein
MAIKQEISIQDVIDVLNQAVALDKDAVEALVEHRVPCNSYLADHPTIQVTQDHKIGLLGILNGLFGADADGWGAIAAVFGDGLKPIKFEDNGRR